jgi:hypothetical protein
MAAIHGLLRLIPNEHNHLFICASTSLNALAVNTRGVEL